MIPRIPIKLKNTINSIFNLSKKLEKEENQCEIKTYTNWNLYLNMIDITFKWCSTNCSYSEISRELNTYDGNFIKDMLKLSNIINELIKITDLVQNFDFHHTFRVAS